LYYFAVLAVIATIFSQVDILDKGKALYQAL